MSRQCRNAECECDSADSRGGLRVAAWDGSSAPNRACFSGQSRGTVSAVTLGSGEADRR